MIVISDRADFFGSATLVAVTVTVVFEVTAGAWKRPLLEIVPPEAVHVTAVFVVLATDAVRGNVPEEVSMASAGVTVTQVR